MSRMIWHRRADAESGMSPDTFRSRAKAPRPLARRRSQSYGGRANGVHRTRSGSARFVVGTNKKMEECSRVRGVDAHCSGPRQS